MSSDSAKREGPPKHSRLSAGATTELYLKNRGKLKASEPKENYKSTFNQTILDCIKVICLPFSLPPGGQVNTYEGREGGYSFLCLISDV